MEFKAKLQNFWYYYKKYVLMAVLAIMILAVGINSCVNRTEYDVNILYITHGYADTFYQTNELVNFFDGYADDVNGDGKKNVQIITINYGDTAKEYTSAGANRAANLAAGKNVLLLLDQQNYDELKSAEFLADLSDLGTSEYLNGDRFEIYNSGMLDNIAGFKEIGDQYYLCIRKFDEQKAKTDGTHAQQYESARKFIKNIIEALN